MVEQDSKAPQGVVSTAELDFRKTLIAAGRKLQPLALSGPEKGQLLIVVSDTLFPQETEALRAKLAADSKTCRESAESVFGSPKLFIAFQDLVSQLVDDPRHLDITLQKKKIEINPKYIKYENTWDKQGPRLKQGEQEQRFLTVLEEHRERFPGVPVSLSTVGQAIGGAVRQRVWHLWRKLEAEDRIPEGLTKLPSGYRPPRKKSA